MKIKFSSMYSRSLNSLFELYDQDLTSSFLNFGYENIGLKAYIDDERSYGITMLEYQYKADIDNDCMVYGYDKDYMIQHSKVSDINIKYGPIFIPKKEFSKITNIERIN